MFRKFLDKWTKPTTYEKLEHVSEHRDDSTEAMDDPSETLEEIPRQPRNFPDLSIIGRAFDDAIAHLRSEQHDSLNRAAAEWIQTETVRILGNLKYELAKLEKCKHAPLSLPAYAIDPKGKLSLSVSVPIILAVYAQDFAEYFGDFVQSCGFTADVKCYDNVFDQPYIIASVSFPKVKKKEKRRKQALELYAVTASTAGLVKEYTTVQKQFKAYTGGK